MEKNYPRPYSHVLVKAGQEFPDAAKCTINKDVAGTPCHGIELSTPFVYGINKRSPDMLPWRRLIGQFIAEHFL